MVDYTETFNLNILFTDQGWPVNSLKLLPILKDFFFLDPIKWGLQSPDLELSKNFFVFCPVIWIWACAGNSKAFLLVYETWEQGINNHFNFEIVFLLPLLLSL